MALLRYILLDHTLVTGHCLRWRMPPFMRQCWGRPHTWLLYLIVYEVVVPKHTTHLQQQHFVLTLLSRMPWVNWYRNVEPSWICCSWRRRKQQPYLSQCVLCINCICRQRVTCFRCLHKIRRMWAIRLRCGWVKIIRQVKRQCVSSSRSLRNSTVSAGSCCSLRYLVIFQIVELEYCGFCYTLCWKQEAQLMLTNPRDMFRGRSRSPTRVPFHMLGRVSSCAIVTLSLRRAVFPIFDFKKCFDIEIQVRGHSRSLKVVPLIDCIWFPISVL